VDLFERVLCAPLTLTDAGAHTLENTQRLFSPNGSYPSPSSFRAATGRTISVFEVPPFSPMNYCGRAWLPYARTREEDGTDIQHRDGHSGRPRLTPRRRIFDRVVGSGPWEDLTVHECCCLRKSIHRRVSPAFMRENPSIVLADLNRQRLCWVHEERRERGTLGDVFGNRTDQNPPVVRLEICRGGPRAEQGGGRWLCVRHRV